jgi:hypothetical protein
LLISEKGFVSWEMKLLLVFLTITLFACNTKKDIIFPEGGYGFVKDSSDLTFPYYPIKKLMNPGDSFYCSYYDSKVLRVFNEPNISIRPTGKPQIRMTYDISVGATYIIDLYEDSIVVKKSLTSMFNQDEKNLTPNEFFQLGYLEINFPLERSERINTPSRIRFKDSLIKLYPQLINPAYYVSLLNKFNAPPVKPFKYSRKITAISQTDYYQVIDDINESGYWKFPLHLPSCKAPWADGAGFILEINTGKRYNNVGAGNCVAGYKEYGLACQKLLDLAEIDKKEEVDIISMFLDE